MQPKPCYRAVNADPGLWGLGLFDLLMLVGCFAAWTHLFARPLRGLVCAAIWTMSVRALRAGRLAGLPRALCSYIWYCPHLSALGSELPEPPPRALDETLW